MGGDLGVALQLGVGEVHDGDLGAEQRERRRLLAAATGQAEDALAFERAEQAVRVGALPGRGEVEVQGRAGEQGVGLGERPPAGLVERGDIVHAALPMRDASGEAGAGAARGIL